MTAPDLFGWARTRLREKSTPVRYRDLADILIDSDDDHPLMLSLRWFESADLRDRWMRGDDRANIPYRYWWWLDFDAADDAVAFAEAGAFWKWELEETHGLVADRDFLPMVSGAKGVKFCGLQLTYAATGWDAAFREWSTGVSPRYGDLIDPAMATQDVTRAPGSAHLKVPGRWQNPIPSDMRGALAKNLRALAATPRPVEQRIGMLPDPSREPGPMQAMWLQEIRDTHVISHLFDEPPRRGSGRKRTAGGQGVDWGAALEAAGLLKREMSYGDRRIWRLHHCPACGERGSNNPFVTEGGRLNCYRSSCEAAFDRYTRGGLPQARWAAAAGVNAPAAGKRSPIVIRGRRREPEVDVQSARKLLATEIGTTLRERKDPALLTIVRSTPGIGKTHAILEAIAEDHRAAGGKPPRTMIGTESHELAAEIAHRLREHLPYFVGKPRVLHLHGRNEDNCGYPEHVGLLGSKGWAPAKYFCPRCPARDSCGYYKQFDAARKVPYIVTAWEQAISIVDSEAAGRFSRVVFDEDPIRALIQNIHTTANDLLALEGDESGGGFGEPSIRLTAALVHEALRVAVRTATDKKPMYLRGSALHELLDIAWRRVEQPKGGRRYAGVGELLLEARAAADRIEVAVGFFAPTGSSNSDTAASDDETPVGDDGDDELLAKIRNFPAINTLHVFESLARDHHTWKNQGATNFLGRSVITMSAGTPTLDSALLRRPKSFVPHLVLDAYADANTYRAVWGVPVRLVDVSVAMPEAVFLRLPIPTSRNAFRSKEGKDRAWQALADVVATLEAGGHRKILIITHKPLVKQVRARYPSLSVRHYWQGRGVDAYKKHTAAVAFGEPDVSPESVVRRTQAIFGGDAQPLDLNASDEHVRLRADERMQLVLDGFREAEIAQAVHRIRPILPPRREVGAEGQSHMFRAPPRRKVVVVIGRIDSPMLPPPIDLSEEAMPVVRNHLAVLRAHSATLFALTPHLTEWWDGPKWTPTRSQREAGKQGMAAVAAIEGATKVKSVAPEEFWPPPTNIQEYDTVDGERRLVHEYMRKSPPLIWAWLIAGKVTAEKLPEAITAVAHQLRGVKDPGHAHRLALTLTELSRADIIAEAEAKLGDAARVD